MLKRILIILLFASLLIAVFYPPLTATEDPYAPEPLPHDSWVDSLMENMTLEQKIGQLIMIRANLNGQYLPQALTDVVQHQVGGIVFFKGTPSEQLRITRELQAAAAIPLFVAIDGEWGLGMRIDSAWSFPRNMTLGAMDSPNLVYDMASEIGRQCKTMGIHINFAPVVDVNSNPRNPVINSRSFGEQINNVTAKGIAYMKGLQDQGIMAVAKHFPGHGNTDKDSHHTLPKVNLSKEEIWQTMLPPFESLIDAGVGGIMTAHMEIPALEKKSKVPVSLSEDVIHRLLQRRMDFKGLVFTDALEMKGVTDFVPAGDVEVMALLAGNDILLLPVNAGKAVASIRKAIEDGRISERMIERKCRKVLLAKRAYQVDQRHLLPQPGTPDLASPVCTALSSRIYGQSVTVLQNQGGFLPLKGTSRFVASLAINASGRNSFQQTLDLYTRMDHYQVDMQMTQSQRDDILSSLGDYPLVLVSLHGLNDWPQRKFGVDSNLTALIRQLQEKHKIILSVFGNPYALNQLGDLGLCQGLLLGYEDNPLSQQAAAQVIAGALPARGKLPVSAGTFMAGAGITYAASEILVHTSPVEAGIRPVLLQTIDSILLQGIRDSIYPGCQVLAARHGKVFYHKAFGYQGYDQAMPVSTGEIYDLASVTKILATTMALMHLYDRGLVNPDQTLGFYLPEVRGSNKENLRIRDMMAHQAGLKPFIPFQNDVRKWAEADPGIWSASQSPAHPIRVAMGMYVSQQVKDSLLQVIITSPLEKPGQYKYSDLGMILLQRVIETLGGMGMDAYLNTYFYQPMGLAHTAFNPGAEFCLNNVVPTEIDSAFRKIELRGDVHDPVTALLGGVAGHAGLFSNAMDAAVLMQMLMNGGTYGGKRYLETATVKAFTGQAIASGSNRRGMGFDRPELKPVPNGPVCGEASQSSFGHSGFTGTYVWADPDNGLVYIFLSNRTWPYGGENKLSRSQIRRQVHSLFYLSMDRLAAMENR